MARVFAAGPGILINPIMKLIRLAAAALLLVTLVFSAKAETTTSQVYFRSNIESMSGQNDEKSTEAAYWSALRAGKGGEAIKYLIMRVNHMAADDTNNATRLLDTLKVNAERMPLPMRSMAYNFIGNFLKDYWQSTAWSSARDRTVADTDDKDIDTWDTERLFREALKYYKLSLEQPEAAQKTPIKDYAEVLERYYDSTPPDTQPLPTLYDFLAHTAIAAFGGELSAAVPATAFVMDDPGYFAPIDEFARVEIKTVDTLSSDYIAISLFRDLLAFRLSQYKENDDPKTSSGLYALVHLDLERLDFVRRRGNFPDADKLYADALLNMADRWRREPVAAYPMYQLAMLYAEQGATGRVNPEMRGRYKDAYDLCVKIEAEYAAAPHIAHYAGLLKASIEAPVVSLTLDATQTSGKPILALAQYRNLDKIFVNVYSVPEDWNVNYYELMRNRKTFSTMKKVSVQQIALPNTNDYQAYSAEVAIDALPQGRYFVLIGQKEIGGFDDVKENEMLASASFYVTSLTAMFRTLPVEMEGYPRTGEVTVLDRETGKPVEGAKFEYWLIDYDKRVNDGYASIYKGAFKTNSEGIALFPREEDSYSYLKKCVITAPGGRRLFMNDINGWRYGYHSYDTYDPDRMHERTIIFTDRAIYRPGQTVYYKLLNYTTNTQGKNQLAKAGETEGITFYDANSRLLESRSHTLNEYGTASGSFVIPQDALNGEMALRAWSGYKTIRVEEYKRPTFEVEFDPVKGNYRLGDQVSVSGKATALAGYAVDGATVQYSVVRSARYRYHWWWMPQIDTSERQIASGEATTREDGTFSIVFDALADDLKDDNLIYNYRVTANVTDSNGETRGSTTAVHLSNKPILVDTDLPDRITNREAMKFRLASTNLNGDPTPAEITVTVTQLEGPDRILRTRSWARPDTAAMSREEFVRLFPNDVYMSEDDPSTYKAVKTLSTVKLSTTAQKAAPGNFDLGMLASEPAGWFRIEIAVKGEGGVGITESRYVELSGLPLKGAGKRQPTKISSMDQWFTMVNNVVEPGGYAELEVAAALEGTPVRYEVIFKGKAIDKRTITAGPVPQTVKIPVSEEHRGGMSVQLYMVQQGRVYQTGQNIVVPYSNKELDVQFETFRDKLEPGQQETWKIRIRNNGGEKAAAEMVATLYDASLDAFAPLSWVDINHFYPQNHSSRWPSWMRAQHSSLANSWFELYRVPQTHAYYVTYPYLNTFGQRYSYSFPNRGMYYGGYRGMKQYSRSSSENQEVVINGFMVTKEMAYAEAADTSMDRLANDEMVMDQKVMSPSVGAAETQQHEEIALRENFNETAFFYPELRTNEKGEIIVEFTIPEALTRWKMLGFAHSKDFSVGTVTNTLITQKEVAISANAPRFLRENDKMEFTAKVNNVSEAGITGEAMLRLYDAETMKPLDDAMLSSKQTVKFSIPQGQSAGVSWTLTIPAGVQAVTYKLTARAGDHTDGEQKTVPVMTNSMLVTETMPFYVRAGETKDVVFKKMKEHNSNTLRNYSYTLEFTSNPAWYAVQSMPYIMEYPHECAEQVFSRFYANSLSSAIVNKTPKLKEVFEKWNELPDSNALLSNLEKNQELKQVLLEETPWVMQARNENERKKRLGLLFDLGRMAKEQRSAIDKLKKYQFSHGGFPWFSQLPPDRYITQHIVAGIEHLRKLGALAGEFERETRRMADNAIGFIDTEIRKDYDNLLKQAKEQKDFDLGKQHIYYTELHYLYACSFSAHKPSSNRQREAFDYYYGQAKKYWDKFSIYGQALAALVMERYGDKDVSAKIIAKLRSEAQRSDEMGMYWRDNRYGYFWYEAPVETQALLIEAFHEIADDTLSIEEMKVWLLRNKQTNDWKTTKATAEACYALLMTGGNLLEEDALLEVTIGGKPLAQAAVEPIKAEEGTGYVKTSWDETTVSSSLADVRVTNPNGKGIGWGGLYWQYFEQLDKITSAETNLKMEKELFVKKVTDRGEVLEPIRKNTLRVGDLVTVRMILRADRAFEYVHLKDMRGAALEPVSTLSGYRHQDGLWYYQNVKDASVNFFISYLPKGTYVFEYDLRVTHRGEFSNGITTFQCMYAPEFSSHSEGIRFKVE